MKKLSSACKSLLIAGLLTGINYTLNIDNVIALEPDNNTSNLKAEVTYPGLRTEGEYTIISPKNFLSGYEPKNPDGTINVVVEIPIFLIAIHFKDVISVISYQLSIISTSCCLRSMT